MQILYQLWRILRSSAHIILLISLATGLFGCVSNLTLSDSIVFSEASGYDLQGFRLIEGGTLTANYIPGANRYGTSIHAVDSIDGLTYLTFTPCVGYGYGVASRRVAAALTAQLFMLGVDATVSPVENLVLTGNITTSSSFGLAFLGRTSRSIAIGPFWRRDRFDGFVFGDGARLLRDMRYFADSFGLKGKLMYSTDSESARIIYIAAGYNPKMESIFLTVGMNSFRIHW